MKSAYKWVMGSAAGLGLLFLTSQKIDYGDFNGYEHISRPAVVGEIAPEQEHGIKDRMKREMGRYEEFPELKMRLLDRYLGELETMIKLNLAGRGFTKFEILDYFDALEEVIREDPDLPDEYASQLE